MVVSLLPAMTLPTKAADVTTSFNGTLTTVNSFYRPSLNTTNGVAGTVVVVGPQVDSNYRLDGGAIYATENSLYNYFTINFTPAETGNYTFTVTSTTLSTVSGGATDDTTMFIYLANEFDPAGTITKDANGNVSDASGPLSGLMYAQDDIAYIAPNDVSNNLKSRIASGDNTAETGYKVGQFDAGTTYTLVLTSYQSDVTGTINVDITGPGSVTISKKNYTSGYAPLPTVTTQAASSVSSTAATLNGTINANGVSTTVTFEYGTTMSYGSAVAATPSPVTGTDVTAVSCALSGLTPNTTYHYRVVGTYEGGTENGSDLTFSTDVTPPTISSASRDSDTQITVTLSEACQNLAKPNNGGFTVTKTGTATTYAVSATAQGTDSSHVVLTVADMGTAAGAGVTVTYATDTNGTIADAVGNALATNSIGKAITAWATSGGGTSSSGSTTNNGAAVIVNGETKTAGTAQTATNSSGQTTTTVTVDTSKLENILASQGTGATVTIPITGNSDVAAGTLTGAMVKNMETKDATLVVQTHSGTYTLPASEININAVSQQLGTSVALSDIKVTVSISVPSASMTKVIESAAQDGGFTIMVPAVDYTITCAHGSQTVNVSSFNAYVERTIAIPYGVDPTKITTGVAVDPDGTTHHVPTKVTVINGKYYAVINSLTNSTYSVVWNPVEFSDVTNHWAKTAINDMGSRMVVNGVGNNNYAPDRNMTRAEFAAIMTRALGLEPGTGASGFGDVASTDWCCGYIKTAAAYGIIKGYDNRNFRPNDTITREQTMAMIARAMTITKLSAGLTDSEINQLLSTFSDRESASTYAKGSIAACLKAGIISGTGATTISPKANITRAEVAVMVARLLQKSNLI
ncbi:S-layer homology domain-containing protein [Oscillibacter sp.]|uniref:S-layer homology domain-containing protein n=1 Tax=Oscillibacter sp. TaxID=1945593 RepID=UPI0033953A2A